METATIESKPAKRGKLKKQGASILFLTPFTVFFLMFTIVPILSAIVLSFTYFNMVSTPTFVGFDNYIRLFFNDDVFLIALRNTAISAARPWGKPNTPVEMQQKAMLLHPFSSAAARQDR